MISKNKFLKNLEQQIEEKHLLKHFFYLAWSKGELSKECLKEYAKEYYHHVRAFPTYLSALHAHTEDAHTRKELLKNLVEEEGSKPNHPDLWKNFAISLGSTEEELKQHKPCAEITTLIDNFKKICSEGSVVEGLAALYSYESQIPEICISKIHGLKKYYGFTNPKDWRYFSVHIAADKEHAKVERELLEKHYSSQLETKAYTAADLILDGLWNFLTRLCHQYEIAC